MQPNDVIRLRHILDAAREAQRLICNRRREELDHDRQLVWALVKAVEIMGEAAGQLSPEARAEIPNIPIFPGRRLSACAIGWFMPILILI